jgi:hypothetical protein
MKQGAFLLVTSSILLHALRLVYGWNVTIGEWTVPRARTSALYFDGLNRPNGCPNWRPTWSV